MVSGFQASASGYMVLPFTMIGKEARRKRFEGRNRFLFRSCQLGDVYAYLMDI